MQNTQCFKVYNQFLKNFLNVNYMNRQLQNSKFGQKQMFGEHTSEENSNDLTKMLFLNKQNITELFYLSPLNLNESYTKSSLQRFFLSDVALIQNLIEKNSEYETNNYNFYDIGIISKVIGDYNDYQQDESESLFNFIKDNTPSVLKIDDGLYKSVIWNILNNGIIVNKNCIIS